MITKELVSEVLGKECSDVVQTTRGEIEVGYSTQDDRYNFINIYELAHKCKEWANNFSQNEDVVDKQVKLYSYVDRFGGHCRIKLFPAQPDSTDVSFSELTEPEAIFKACEWILDND